MNQRFLVPDPVIGTPRRLVDDRPVPVLDDKTRRASQTFEQSPEVDTRLSTVRCLKDLELEARRARVEDD